jgi:hypothetical protein
VLLLIGLLFLIAIGALPPRSTELGLAQRRHASAVSARAGDGGGAGPRLRLRGGTAPVDSSSAAQEGEPAEDEEDEAAREGLFPGKWDLWERLRSEPRCDFNVTDDIVRPKGKAEELAFRRQCDEELERHWARVKRIRAEDVANNRSGCRHVADNEYCIRKSDGRIWKYRYEPDLYSGCGSDRDEELLLPEPVDHVDPDYVDEIADELDARDRERAQSFQDLADAHSRQQALEEALTWFNGTRRWEFEAGEPVWWRQVTRANASAYPPGAHEGRPRAAGYSAADDGDEREGPHLPDAAQGRAASEDLSAGDSSSGADGSAMSGEVQTVPPRPPLQQFRAPGHLPRGAAPPDFSSYGDLPAGYCFRDAGGAPQLDAVQALLYDQIREEAGAILSGTPPAGSDVRAAGHVDSDVFAARAAGANATHTAQVMAGWAGSLFNSSASSRNFSAGGGGAGAAGCLSVCPSAGAPLGASPADPDVELRKSEGYVWDELGETLRSVVWRGKAGFVQELVDLGADVNYRTVYCGWRPLHYAAWNDYPKIVAQLVAAGADLNARTDYGETPLHLCALKASNQALQCLLDAGADTSLRHVQGRLPLESAHMRMLSCDFPLSRRIGETVRLLANATRDAAAVQDALEDLRDHWAPPAGYCS